MLTSVYPDATDAHTQLTLAWRFEVRNGPLLTSIHTRARHAHGTFVQQGRPHLRGASDAIETPTLHSLWRRLPRARPCAGACRGGSSSSSVPHKFRQIFPFRSKMSSDVDAPKIPGRPRAAIQKCLKCVAGARQSSAQIVSKQYGRVTHTACAHAHRRGARLLHHHRASCSLGGRRAGKGTGGGASTDTSGGASTGTSGASTGGASTAPVK